MVSGVGSRGWVESEFAEEFARRGVDDADVCVVDEDVDGFADVCPADADVVQSAVVSQCDRSGFVAAVVSDPLVGVRRCGGTVPTAYSM